MVNDNLAYADAEHEEVLTDESEDTIKWCSIPMSEVLDRGLRLEASVFDTDGRRAIDLVKSCKYDIKTIGGTEGLASAYTCPRFKRNWVDYSEFPIYQPSSILDLYPQPDGYIAKDTDTDIERLRVHKNQVLITCSGTIGKVAFVSKSLDQKIFSHDLLRVNCYDEEDAGYLYAYVRTDIGNKIITSNEYGSVVSHIEAEHLANMVIPYPPKPLREKIGQLVINSYALRDEANELWEKALKLLYKELDLKPFRIFKEEAISEPINTFSVRLSDLNGRLDGSYHDQLVKKELDYLATKADKIVMLGDPELTDSIFLPERFKRVYVSPQYGTKMFGIKQITTLDPFTDKYLALGCISPKLQEKLLLQPGTILISRSGTIGNLCIVLPHWKNWIASEDLIRVNVHEEIQGYVYCFLSSEYGQMLIKRFAFGSVQDHIDCDQVAQIAIPLLKNKAVQDEINRIVMECNQKRSEAYSLEMTAINIVNHDVLGLP